MEMEQNEFGPKPVLACPLPVFGVTAFATKWGSSASHKSPCRRTARDERVSLIFVNFAQNLASAKSKTRENKCSILYAVLQA